MEDFEWKEKGLEFREYKGRNLRKGIDDLKYTHPWGPTAQGDHSWADRIEDSNDWLMFYFDECDEHDAEGVKKAIADRIKWNEDYIEELKRTGEYGKETEGCTLVLAIDPLLDEPCKKWNEGISSYTYDIFDFSKPEVVKTIIVK